MALPRSHYSAIFFILALVFTVGLTFASVELPYLIDQYLINHLPTPGFDSHADERSQFMTELFIGHYNLRLIGYISFALVVSLIVAGFISGKSGFAAAGAIACMLPVFAQFAGVMFFLAGLGALNIIWMPMLDLPLEIQTLGRIIRAPADFLIWLFRQIDLNIYWPLTCACIGSGLLIFLAGTFAWLKTRAGGGQLASALVYRYSRHPQYLGWILWSYGLYLLLQLQRYPKRSWGIDASLSWLLATMVIIGVAMLEEVTMARRFGERYAAYRKRTPFLIPLPKPLIRAFSFPTRVLFKKDYPERPREVIILVSLYTTLMIGASAFLYEPGLDRVMAVIVPGAAEQTSMARLEAKIKETDNGRERYFLSVALAEYGPPSLPFFLSMLKAPQGDVRIAAAEQLREMSAPSAIPALREALRDSLEDVRGNVLRALGRMKPAEAVGDMKRLLDDPVPWVRSRAMRELASMGVEEVSGPAIVGIADPSLWYRISCIDVLGTLSNPLHTPVIEGCLEDSSEHVRRAAVVALARIASPQSRGALEAALRDPDWEVRMYAAEALKIVSRETEREK